MTPRGCSKLQPTASSRTCHPRCTNARCACRGHTNRPSDIVPLRPPPSCSTHTSRFFSPHWSFPVLAIPLVDNRLSSSSHFKAGQPAQLRPLSGGTRGSQKRSSGEKKEKGRKKKASTICKKANHEPENTAAMPQVRAGMLSTPASNSQSSLCSPWNFLL
jgi:hypothetical protein